MGWRYWLAIRTYRRGPPCPRREGPHEAQAPRCTSCRRDCTSCPPVPGPSRGCSQAPVQAVVAVAVAAAGRSCGSLAQLAGPSWHHGLSGCRSHRQRQCGCTTRARPEPGSSTAEWRRGSAAPPWAGLVSENPLMREFSIVTGHSTASSRQKECRKSLAMNLDDGHHREPGRAARTQRGSLRGSPWPSTSRPTVTPRSSSRAATTRTASTCGGSTRTSSELTRRALPTQAS